MSHVNPLFGGRGAAWAAIAGIVFGVAAMRSSHAADPIGDDVSPLDRLLGPAQPAPVGRPAGADQPRGVEEVANRPPAPASADIAAAEKRLREAYAADLEQIRDPVRRRKLFDEMIGAALEKDTPAPGRWAAVELARAIAAEAGEATLVRRALETRVALFADQDLLGAMMDFLQAARDAGLKRGSPELIAAALDVNREALAAARRDANRVAIAGRAVGLAALLLPELPANDQDKFRPLVRTQQERTDEIAAICEAAAAARGVLQGNPDDHAANAAAGFAAAWAGEWATAADHLRRTKDRKLKAAAEKEAAAAQPPPEAEAFDLAEAWWDAVVENGADKVLAPRPSPQPTKAVRNAIMMHAADCYKKALPGLNQIDRKLAEKRIEEAARAQQNEERGEKTEDDREDKKILIVKGPAFDENRFAAAEDRRALLFRQLGNAWIERRRNDVGRLQQDLTMNRTEWAGSLHLQNRDAALPRKQQLVTEILQRDPKFADGWLCDAYLAILAGDREKAVQSLDEADKLMDADAKQLFCGQQLLDAAQALLMLGDIERAQGLKNALENRFPRDPGVKFLGARIDTEQRQFRQANQVLREMFREPNPSLWLAAEYAWFKAANPIEELRDFKEADQALQMVLKAGKGPLWKALRAQAAVLAADGRWDDAIQTLDGAAEQAPLVFGKDIAAQRDAYVKRESFDFNTIKKPQGAPR